ncbi:MAG: hypothetical protein ACHQQ3_09345 [Gemmatimonadales bacterium]
MNSAARDEAFEEWAARQHEAITGDPVWRLNCYREAMFLLEGVGDDIRELDR